MAQQIGGRYVLSSEPPASGGMADVYAAYDLESFREVAVKVLRPTEGDDALTRVFFERESRALTDLHHPSIVELLDAGFDPELNRYYLVLEWMPGDLLAQFGPALPLGWDDFAAWIGFPILGALAFAHSRNVVHRDVKPSNVLVDAGQGVKLADFGISKIKRQLSRDGRTLAQYFSPPYAPPDELSNSSYSRDVFAFGVLALRCLSSQPVEDYSDIDPALDGLSIDDSIREILTLAVARDPTKRQPNAEVLLATLEGCQQVRRGAAARRYRLFVKPRDAVRRAYEKAMPDAFASFEESLAADLREAVHVSYKLDYDHNPPRRKLNEFNLYGSQFSYHGVLDPSAAHLELRNADVVDEETLDRRRHNNWMATCSFEVGLPTNRGLARQAVEMFEEGVALHFEQADADRERREADELFREWGRQLDAKTRAEEVKEAPLAYTSVRFVGSHPTFTLEASPTDDLVGERRVARPLDAGRGRYAEGEIAELIDDQVTLYLDDPEAKVPPIGELVRDTFASKRGIDHQRRALDAVRWGSKGILRPELRELIVHPDAADASEPVEPARWFNHVLDEDKKTAVRRALATKDWFLVQGPPGTGKTQFIAELVLVTPHRNDDSRRFGVTRRTERAARLQRPSLLAFETGADVLHASVEPTGVLRRGDEAEPLIEADSIVVDRVADDESSGDGLTRGERLAEGLRKQERSASLALVAAVDGEPCQQDHPCARVRVAPGALPLLFRCREVGRCDAADRASVTPRRRGTRRGLRCRRG